MTTYLYSVVEQFSELSLATVSVLAGVLLLGILLLAASKKVQWNARMISYAALAISMSFVLSYIRIYRMPQGGSLTLGSLLPLMLFAYAYGPLAGCVAGAAYGMLQLLQDMYMVHPVQLLLDYPLAFAAVGLTGLASRLGRPSGLSGRLFIGIWAGGLARIVFHVVSGAVFFGMYAPEGQNPWVYSTLYNLTTLLPDVALCAFISLVPAFRVLLEYQRPPRNFYKKSEKSY
ncbi:MAG: energy-coupled thiamine transporter ThiT [Peptococcaceae bacterium]|jgi:thiamine transporter|nr:energy-coupled thiamine transporter ThiT [Peptococcaceae bacterium]